jgi:hypothetical protein
MNSAYLDALVNGGMTIPMKALDPGVLERGLQDLFLCELFYGLGTAMIKISFGLTLLRVLAVRWQRWMAWTILTITILDTIGYAFWTIFLCKPVSYACTVATNPTGGSCKSYVTMTRLTYVHSAVMLLADAGLGLVLPIFLLKPLQMKMRLKVTAGLTLGLASM